MRRRIKAAVAPTVFLLLATYFVWNATQGEHGLRAYARRQDDLRAALAERDRAEAERAAWERRISALRTSRLDRDALEERARDLLNMAEPTDIVVPLKSGELTF